MKLAKLVSGNVYVVGDIFFERGQEVEVSDELAKELATFDVKDWDSDSRSMREIKYFEIVDVKSVKAEVKPKAETKADS